MKNKNKKPDIKSLDDLKGQHLVSLKHSRDLFLTTDAETGNKVTKLLDNFDIETDNFYFSVIGGKNFIGFLSKLEFYE
jgi:hypothetical protein